MKKQIEIIFKNKSDFRKRIATLWQDQKENEIYKFIFLDKESEQDFEDLYKCFCKDNKGQDFISA